MPTDTEKSEAQLQAEKEVAELHPIIVKSLFGDSHKTPDQIKADEAKAAEAAATAAKVKSEEEAAKKAEDDKKAKEEADKKVADSAAEAAKSSRQATASMPTADEIASKVADRMKPDEKAKPDTNGAPELSREDQQNRNVIEFMAKESPEYGRLLKRFDAFIPAEKNYRENWEKANPGKTYNPADEDHAAFYEANDPIQTETDQAAFDRAQTRFEARQMAEEIVSEREGKRQWEEAAAKARAKLATIGDDVTRELLAETDPALAKINPAKLREEDPFADAAIRPYAPMLTALSAELEKAFTPGLNYQLSDKVPIQLTLLQTIYGYENELLKLDPKDRINDGKVLAPIEEYNKMSPAERSKHWTIWMEPKSVRALLVRDFSVQAKEYLTLLRSKAGKTETPPAPKTAPKPEDKKAKTEPKDKGKKEFPNTSGGALNSANGGGTDVIDATDAKKITAGLFA